jgi:hypothetical protein
MLTAYAALHPPTVFAWSWFTRRPTGNGPPAPARNGSGEETDTGKSPESTQAVGRSPRLVQDAPHIDELPSPGR